jgi:tetratricopeptide (TPR) repeat protein
MKLFQVWGLRALLVAAVSLSGCASLPHPGYEPALPAALPRRVELVAVPFHPQQDYQCGPAALATVLGHAGVARTPQQLVDEVYLPQRQGSLQLEMLGATRRAGLLPYRLEATPQALLAELAAGHPVVVLQNLRLEAWPQWHYAVVVGYDRVERQFLLRSGQEQRLLMGFDEFDRSWARADRWAFVALPPDRLPATASEQDFVAAATVLERAAPAAAAQAYRTALAAWPGQLVARLALGNLAYRERKLAEAEVHYQQAAVDHPEAADAWNNLAQVRHERGQPAAAQVAASKAVALGGPRLATYQATLSSIEASPTPASAR